MNTLSVRVRQLREKKGLSQEQLALETGTSQRQVSKYETGKQEPTAHVLLGLAIALDTTTDYLLGQTDNPSRLLRDEDDLDVEEREILSVIRNQPQEQRRRIMNAVRALVN